MTGERRPVSSISHDSRNTQLILHSVLTTVAIEATIGATDGQIRGFIAESVDKRGEIGMQVTTAGRFPFVCERFHELRDAVQMWRTRSRLATPEAAGQDTLLAAAQAATARELIAAQEATGVDILGDGYIPIYDEWFAWAGTVAGVAPAGTIRYLDTNTYYHRWRLTEQPRRLGSGPHVAAYRRATALTTKPVKPCLFGPYTVWASASKEGAGGTPAALDALADIWAEDVAELGAAGARYVQLEESVLLRPGHRGNLPLAARALQRIAAAAPGVTVIVHFAFGAVGDLLAPLLDLPVGGLGFDFTDVHRVSNLAALRGWHGDKLVQAGVVNAREIRVETAAEVADSLAAVTAWVPPGRCLAGPSAGLLYVPRHAAFEKLASLAAGARLPAPDGRPTSPRREVPV